MQTPYQSMPPQYKRYLWRQDFAPTFLLLSENNCSEVVKLGLNGQSTQIWDCLCNTYSFFATDVLFLCLIVTFGMDLKRNRSKFLASCTVIKPIFGTKQLLYVSCTAGRQKRERNSF